MQDKLIHWVRERLSILHNREAGLPKPWTKDPILQNYRFCNVEREKDTVTQWIKKNWRDPYDPSNRMAFAMVVARTINWPDTLEELEFPHWTNMFEWKERARDRMKARRQRGDKVWTGAYLVSTNGVPMDKIDYIIDRVWTPFFDKGKTPTKEDTLESYWKHLTEFDGLGSFMAAQVVCDLKYTSALKHAEDWYSWAALGPGSIRGINRYLGRKVTASMGQTEGLQHLQQIQQYVNNELNLTLHCQDIQNCMCEYDKYMRVLNEEGKPRSRYAGH